MKHILVLAVLLSSSAVLADAVPAKKGQGAALTLPEVRKPTNRVLTLTDELLRSSVPELFVAPGTPTTVLFPVNLDKKKLLLADPGGLFYPPIVQGNTIVILAKSELPPAATIPLSVALDDGTVVGFVLRRALAEADLTVTVELKLTKGSAPESNEALKQTIAQLQAKLDEVQANAGNSAVNHVAGLILGQEPGTAVARTFEQHRVHSRDKQSRLLTEAFHLYRLFNYSYLLLSVENRDPSRTWVFDRAEVRLLGNDTTTVKVPFSEADIKSLPPEETAKVVVVFETLAQVPGQKFSVTLLEKGGPRHVTLEFEP